jgi:hypothetical protein
MNPLYLTEIQGDLDRYRVTAALVAAGQLGVVPTTPRVHDGSR